MPTINIFIPTFEPKPEHLRQALESVLAQTFQDWTVLIHDDASPKSNVREILGPYLRDPRITLRQSAERLGIGGNWNACLTYADAPYVQYLFQDDTWEPLYLQKSIEALQADPALAFTAANHQYRDDDGRDVGGRYGEIKVLRDRLFTGKSDGRSFLLQWIADGLTPNLIGEPSFVLMRRATMERAGRFSEKMPQFLDVEYWTRLLVAGDWYGIRTELGVFRVHPDGASAQNSRSGQGIFDRFRCLQTLVSTLPSGPERRAAARARNASLDTMIEKFLLRLIRRQPVIAGGQATESLTISDAPVLMLGCVRYVLRAPWRMIRGFRVQS